MRTRMTRSDDPALPSYVCAVGVYAGESGDEPLHSKLDGSFRSAVIHRRFLRCSRAGREGPVLNPFHHA